MSSPITTTGTPTTTTASVSSPSASTGSAGPGVSATITTSAGTTTTMTTGTSSSGFPPTTTPFSTPIGTTDATPNQRSFLRPSTAICVFPSATSDACVMVDEPTSNCLCEPTPPPVLPDTNDTGVQCSVDADEYSAFLTQQFDNVTTLERAFKEARKEASNTLDVLCEQLEKSQVLEDEHEKLKQRLSTLTWKMNLC